MESIIEVPPTKSKVRTNLHVAECIRQFELPRQFPSTITEFHVSKQSQEKNVTSIQTKNMQNIISALPLSGKMKFIPNKEVSFSENLQKLKLKLPDGRDLGEVKLILPGFNDKIQSKLVTMSKIGQKIEKPITWRIKSQSHEESNIPRIKSVTRLFNNSSCSDELSKPVNDTSPKVQVHIINSNNNSGKIIQDHTKSIIKNTKSLSTINSNDTSKKKIVVHKVDGDLLKKFIDRSSVKIEKQNPSQLITLKQLTGSQKLIVMQKDNNHVLKPVSDRTIKLKSLTNTSLNNHFKNNADKIIFKSALNGSIIRKRDSSAIEYLKFSESKRPCLNHNAEDVTSNNGVNIKLVDNEQKSTKLNNCVKPTINIAPKKNIMVIVPNEITEEIKNNSSEILNQSITKKIKSISSNIQTNDNSIIETSNADFNDKIVDSSETVLKSNQERQISTNESNKTMKTKSNLCDKFSILEKAVLSVQDANLRAKALKALKDCGIKVRKSVSKRPTNTKLISESTTQTDVFSLLKHNEFIQTSEEVDNLVKIKLTQKLMKQPINTISSNQQRHKISVDENCDTFKKELDMALNKVFSGNKGVADVKEALKNNKVTRAKMILNQLQMDFEAARIYDNDGFLGIHRAVMDNNIREVQRHIIILNSIKQSIDVYTQDDKTSLELAVEFDVNPQIVKILLDAGAQPVSSKYLHDSALILASKKSSKVLSLFFKYISRKNLSKLNDKNSEGFAAIHYCAQNGNYQGVVDLLKYGAEVNLQEDRSGRTALFFAVDTKSPDVSQDIYNEIAHKLVEYGAISNIQTFSKHSVLSLIDEVKCHPLKLALNRAVK